MTYLTSGNRTVDSMGTINITGNVIPQIWYSVITKPNGKPNLLAITLLSDIVYWYRPTEVRDEQTGRVIAWKKKFKGETLQKTYQQYANLYGESKHSVKEAIKKLEELGVISKEFRDIDFGNGMVLNNVMYISLNTDILYQLTYPQEFPTKDRVDKEDKENKEIKEASENIDDAENVADTDVKNEEELTSSTENSAPLPHFNAIGGRENSIGYRKIIPDDIQKASIGDSAKSTELLEENEPHHKKTKGSNTENNTEITNNQDIDKMDILDRISAYTEVIKNNIEYQSLIEYAGYDRGLIDDILKTLVEMVSVHRDSVKILGVDYPYDLVKDIFLKLDYDHIVYAYNCLKDLTKEKKALPGYIVSTLYNTYKTMETYYQLAFNRNENRN